MEPRIEINDESKRKAKKRSNAIWLTVGIVLVTLVAWSYVKFYRAYPYQQLRAYKVSSASMCPTICENDRIIAATDAYFGGGPQRGYVIMMKHATSQALFVKRVIGVEGDIVSVRPGEISVNGQPLVEPKYAGGCGGTSSKPRPYDDLELYGDVKVPKSSFFVVGDNLANSFDSRFRGFGLVTLSQVRGRPLFIYWSVNASRIGCSIR
jgi:signal peptidase I